MRPSNPHATPGLLASRSLHCEPQYGSCTTEPLDSTMCYSQSDGSATRQREYHSSPHSSSTVAPESLLRNYLQDNPHTVPISIFEVLSAAANSSNRVDLLEYLREQVLLRPERIQHETLAILVTPGMCADMKSSTLPGTAAGMYSYSYSWPVDLEGTADHRVRSLRPLSFCL